MERSGSDWTARCRGTTAWPKNRAIKSDGTVTNPYAVVSYTPILILRATKPREDDEHKISQGQMLIAKTEDECCLDLAANTRLLLFGGAPLPEERFLYWNFVSSSKDRIEQAKADWRAREFPEVAGDDSYIPLPE